MLVKLLMVSWEQACIVKILVTSGSAAGRGSATLRGYVHLAG